jgi:hypothetical protein
MQDVWARGGGLAWGVWCWVQGVGCRVQGAGCRLGQAHKLNKLNLTTPGRPPLGQAHKLNKAKPHHPRKTAIKGSRVPVVSLAASCGKKYLASQECVTGVHFCIQYTFRCLFFFRTCRCRRMRSGGRSD